MENIELSVSTEKNSFGMMHVKRFWEKSIAKRSGRISQAEFIDEWNLDITLLSALGLGLEQTMKYIYLEQPTLDEFEKWIIGLNGGNIEQHRIENFNAIVLNEKTINGDGLIIENVLDEQDLEFWEANGYVIIRNVVSKEDCNKTIDVICNFLGIDIHDPSTWYLPHPARQGIMVQLFQDPQLEKNRRSESIRNAYKQLWDGAELWCNTDRVSFNPPENEKYRFPGPRLHWDVSLELPIPFGLQGLLYLSDTQANQGAFTLIPGFHKKIEGWIRSLPPGSDPRTQDLYSLGPVPVVANAGDFIIWHQALPHGSSPNTASVPRIVQYINYLPVDPEIKKQWK